MFLRQLLTTAKKGICLRNARHRKVFSLFTVLIMAVFVFALAVQPVEAEGEATIEIIAPGDIPGWALSPDRDQPMTQTGTLTVTTTNVVDGKSWSVTASDNDPNTNGYMTKWNGTYDPDTKLATPMQIEGPTGTVTLPGPGPILTGSDNVTSQPYTVTFRQWALWIDAVVVSPDCYRIVVTFTGSITS